MLRVAEQHSILCPESIAKIQDHLTSVVFALERNQLPDGSWSANWHRSVKGAASKAGWYKEDPTTAIVATGHHLEWLVLLPQRLQANLSSAMLTKAANFALHAVEQESRDKNWLATWYCPASHAVRMCYLLGGITPPRIVLGIPARRQAAIDLQQPNDSIQAGHKGFFTSTF